MYKFFCGILITLALHTIILFTIGSVLHSINHAFKEHFFNAGGIYLVIMLVSFFAFLFSYDKDD